MQKGRTYHPARNPPGAISGHRYHQQNADQGSNLQGTVGTQADPAEESEQRERQRYTKYEGADINQNGSLQDYVPAYLRETVIHIHHLLFNIKHFRIPSERLPSKRYPQSLPMTNKQGKTTFYGGVVNADKPFPQFPFMY
jgi:hypothetical protein